MACCDGAFSQTGQKEWMSSRGNMNYDDERDWDGPPRRRLPRTEGARKHLRCYSRLGRIEAEEIAVENGEPWYRRCVREVGQANGRANE